MNAFHVLVAAALAAALAGCAEPVLEEPPVGRVYACPVERAWEVVEQVVRDLHYTTREDRLGSDGGILRAWSFEDGDLYVRVGTFWEGTTLVSVAVPNGSRDAIEGILGRIDHDLRPGAASGRGIPTGVR